MVTLRSRTCEKFTCIKDDDVEVVDGQDDEDSHFIVHVKRPGVVALQSKTHKDNWLGIISDSVTGSVRGMLLLLCCCFVLLLFVVVVICCF